MPTEPGPTIPMLAWEWLEEHGVSLGPTVLASYAAPVASSAARPAVLPNVHPECGDAPRINDDGFEELCHLVTEQDPDTALCGKDVTGYPWDPPWPRCEACLAVARGEMN